jgi:hypothetical protein
MIEYTAICVDEKPRRSMSKKWRFAVAAILTVAALGARQLHQRALPQLASDAVQTRAVADVAPAAEISGPNNLLGDVRLDKEFEAPIGTVGVNDLELASSVDLAGLDRAVEPSLDHLESGSLQQIDVAAAIQTQGSLSAVPEPTTAGMLLLAAAPVVGLRRSRSQSSAQKISTTIKA